MDGNHRDRFLALDRAQHRVHLGARKSHAAQPRGFRLDQIAILGVSGEISVDGKLLATPLDRHQPATTTGSGPEHTENQPVTAVEDLHDPRCVTCALAVLGREDPRQHPVADAGCR